jgi:hypothetical protein
MIIVRCAKCKRKIFKYRKVGKGKLLHCWKDRLIEDYTLRKQNEVRCECGNLIGIDEGKWIKMKQHTFFTQGP